MGYEFFIFVFLSLFFLVGNTFRYKRLKILHIINSLGIGGAENSLYNLVRLDLENSHIVVSLSKAEANVIPISSLGVQVYFLNFRSPFFFIEFVKLIKIVRYEKPAVIQTWLYVSDLIGSLAVVFFRKARLFWNIRNGSLNPLIVSKASILTAYLCSYLAKKYPQKIICCSNAAIKVHVDFGYQRSKFYIIHNSVDVGKFNILNHTTHLQRKFNIESDILTFGYVGRYDPQKGHSVLYAALALYKLSSNLKFKLLLAGTNITNCNSRLMDEIHKFSLQDNVILLGPQDNIVDVYQVLDIHILPSLSEGFPNVVAESMACGIPNVVSDVGEAAYIVGDCGWVCEKSDPESMLKSIIEAVNERSHREKWQRRKEACRNRIVTSFAEEKMLQAYINVWNSST